MAAVSVRELRQNLSVHLRRVERGETLEVTRRGERVAILGPLPERRWVPTGSKPSMVRAGRAVGSRTSPPRIDGLAGASLSAILERQREEHGS